MASDPRFPEALYAAIWEEREGPPLEARHGLSPADFQHTLNQLRAQEYRLIDISGYYVGNDVRYAGIWEQGQGPAWDAKYDLKPADYERTSSALVAQGYRLIDVSGYSDGNEVRFAAIWEQRQDPAWEARYDLSTADYQRASGVLATRGFRVVDLSVYGVGNDVRYAAIWEQRTGPALEVSLDLSAADYQTTFDGMVARGFRVTAVSGCRVGNDLRYAAIWEKRQDPAWLARHGQVTDDYQQTFNEMVARGYRLVDVSGYSQMLRVADYSVVTQHNDNARTGAFLNETTLTPARVGGPRFGRLYERHVEGDPLAQILYVRNVPGTRLGTKNLFFVATSTNDVYAFDADDYRADPGAGLVWHVRLGNTRLLNTREICQETIGTVGVTSTPVIDVATQTMYVVARDWTKDGPPSNPRSVDLGGDHYLHALKLSDGTPRVAPRKVEGPFLIKDRRPLSFWSILGAVLGLFGALLGGLASAPERKVYPSNGETFKPCVQRNRPGLLLLNGVVYIGFGTFQCDQGKYHGWVFGYGADTLEPRAIFCTTETKENQWGGGIWQSGNGLVGTDDGHIFLETGNDVFEPKTDQDKADPPKPLAYADAFVKLKVTRDLPGLVLAGSFQPSNAKRLRDGDRDASYNPTGVPDHSGDTDLGSGGPVLLPGGWLIGGGKQGRYYVLNAETMDLGKDQDSRDPVNIGEGFQAFRNTYHPELTESDYAAGEWFGPNIHGGPVYWPGPSYVYQMPEKDYLKAYHYDPVSGKLDYRDGPAGTAIIRPPEGMPGGHSSLSANGGRDGIVWTVVPSGNGQWNPVPGTLHAFDAMPATVPGHIRPTLNEIWADLEPERFAKFNPPTIANGKVFRPVFAEYKLYEPRDPRAGGPGGLNPAEPHLHQVHLDPKMDTWPAPERVGPGKVIVYGMHQHVVLEHIEPIPGARLIPGAASKHSLSTHAQWRRWPGGGDQAPKWTIGEFVGHFGGTGVFAAPLGEELEVGDERGGRRRDFAAMVPSRRHRVSVRDVSQLDDPTCHKPPSSRMEVQASIFWSEATAAHAVMGEIRDEYLRLGGPTGELGYPVESETDSEDNRGRVSSFERGAIVWNPETGVELQLRPQE